MRLKRYPFFSVLAAVSAYKSACRSLPATGLAPFEAGGDVAARVPATDPHPGHQGVADDRSEACRPEWKALWPPSS